MAESPATDELFGFWRKQIEAGTEAWAKAVSQMAGQGRSPGIPPDPAMFWRPFMDQSMSAWAQLFSAGPASPELLAQWKKFLDDWIAAWTKALEQAMGTEAFAQALGTTLDQFLTAQGAVKQTLDRSSKALLETTGLPSREQIIGLSRQLMDLEDRIEALEDSVASLGRRAPSTSSLHEEGPSQKTRGTAGPAKGSPGASARRGRDAKTRKKGRHDG